jgi:hypothetical protein
MINEPIEKIISYYTKYPIQYSYKFGKYFITINRRGNTSYGLSKQKQYDSVANQFLQADYKYLYHLVITPGSGTTQYDSYAIIKEHSHKIRRYLTYRKISFIFVIESNSQGQGHIHIAIKSNIELDTDRFPVIPNFSYYLTPFNDDPIKLIKYLNKQNGKYITVKRSLFRLQHYHNYGNKQRNDIKKLFNLYYISLLNIRFLYYHIEPPKYPKNPLKTPKIPPKIKKSNSPKKSKIFTPGHFFVK